MTLVESAPNSPDILRRQAEIERHWQSVACSTAPIDEDRARTAISELMLEVSGQRTKAVICLSSPHECLVAAGFVRGPLEPKKPEALSTREVLLLADVRPGDMPGGADLRPAAIKVGQAAMRNYWRSLGSPLGAAVQRFRWPGIPDTAWHRASAKIKQQSRHLPDDVRAGLFRRTGRAKKLPQAWDRSRPTVLNVDMGVYYMYLAHHELATAEDLGGDLPYLQPRLYERLREACEACGSFWLLGDVAFVSDRPEVVRLDTQGRAHAVGGPAIRYRDGFEIHAMEGMELDPILLHNPGEAAVRLIEQQGNAEVRRVMISAMGVERYLALSGAGRVHEDDTGILWKRSYHVHRVYPSNPRAWRMPEARALCFVEVVNGTREADGSRRHYFLRVPPGMMTARAAVAWTYGLKPEQYVPTLRT